MGTMNKMRENTGVILWILVFAFGVIWVLQDSGGLDVVGNTAATNVIVVDGDAVTYEEYAQALDAQVQQYQQQNDESMPPQQLDQERERVFNALVEDKLREHEMDRLGIDVTDDEVIDMVLGEEPHPIITIYFGDGQGGVDQALLQNFIANPDAQADWVQIENYLRTERRRQKLDALISASVRVSNAEVVEEHRKQNQKADAEWFGLRYASLPDDSVEVNDRDLRSFYNEHRDEFERKRTYGISYASVSKDPSSEDTLSLMRDLERIKARFMDAEDDSLFLSRNASERPFTGAWFRADELTEDVSQLLFPDPQVGSVLGPVVSGREAHLVKVLETRPAEEPAVRARHILFRATGDELEEKRPIALDVRQRLLNGDDFGSLAIDFSDDGSKFNGGDLGWFGPGKMVEPFENAAFGARIGQIVGPIETQFGLHLIEVTARADQEVRVADFVHPVRADVGTLNAIQEQLEDLRYFAGETGNFESEAERLGLSTQRVQVESDQAVIPGIGNSRRLLNFLETADEGAVSEVIELDAEFIVASVEEITPEGYRPFDDVRAELEPRVRIEKKKDILSARLQAALDEHGFDGLAGALNTTVRTTTGVNFNMAVVPNLGREPLFTGTVLGMEAGEVSGVLEGEASVFVVKVTGVTPAREMTEDEIETQRNQIVNQRRARVQREWIAALRENAEVEDFRSRFEQ